MLKCDEMRLTDKNTFTKEDYFDIVSYAQWLETLSSLVNRKIFSFDAIDDMYNYLFFIFVNNKYIQETELVPSQKFYKGIYKTYREWTKYLVKQNKEILCEKTTLDKVKNFDDICLMK